MKKIISALLAMCICLCIATLIASCDQAGADNGNEVQTTVNEAEWNAAFAKSNFTLNGYATEIGEQESLTMKFSDSAIYTENDGLTRFYVKQDDGWHITDGVHMGPVMNGFSASVSFAMMTFRIPEYSSFSYDEVTKAYVYTSSEAVGFYQFNVYFENGFIVKIEGCEEEGPITHSFAFTDYGTTVVELPGGEK